MAEKIYIITKTQVVKAKNKGNAQSIVIGDDDVPGAVLASSVNASEISKEEALKYIGVVEEADYIYDDYLSQEDEEMQDVTFASKDDIVSVHSSTINFLRSENKKLAKMVDKYKNVKEEASNAVYQAAYEAFSSFELPNVSYKPYASNNKSTPETAVAVFADWQLGKITKSYNSDVLAKRIELYTEKMLEIVNIQRMHHNVDTLHVWLLGDIVEGEEIFPGQSHLLDAGLYRQVGMYGPEILVKFLTTALQNFKHIHITGVIGNHGAVGGRARRQHDPETNMDRLLYKIIQWIFKDEKRISFNIPDGRGERSFYAIDRVGSYSSLLIHGDQMPAPSSFHGYYKKVMGWKDGAIPEDFEDVFMGHYHQQFKMTIGSGILRISGSPESHNTYAQEYFQSMSRPCQHLMFIHPERGITSEYSIWLDEV